MRVWHAGFSADIGFYPELNASLAVLTNNGSCSSIRGNNTVRWVDLALCHAIQAVAQHRQLHEPYHLCHPIPGQRNPHKTPAINIPLFLWVLVVVMGAVLLVTAVVGCAAMWRVYHKKQHKSLVSQYDGADPQLREHLAAARHGRLSGLSNGEDPRADELYASVYGEDPKVEQLYSGTYPGSPEPREGDHDDGDGARSASRLLTT